LLGSVSIYTAKNNSLEETISKKALSIRQSFVLTME
jgi:hypothetical protein